MDTHEMFKRYQSRELAELKKRKPHLINPITGWQDSRHNDRSKLQSEATKNKLLWKTL